MKEFGSPYKVIDSRKYNTWCRWTKRLDTYGRGCQHDCDYCYARALLNFRGLFDVDLPALANLETVRAKLNGLTKHDVVRIGSMTDCFQPIETTHKLTYRTILLLNYLRISYLIVTKSDLVASDKYVAIYDKDLAHFQISITSTDDYVCRTYENAPPPSRRIKAVEKLQGLGFDVSVRLSPFLFEFCDISIINGIQCSKILIEFLKVNHWIKKNFAIDYSEYTVSYGGHQNLTLQRKIELAGLITGFEQVSVGEYVRDHYEYFRDNVNYNKNDCCNLTLRKLETHKQLTLK